MANMEANLAEYPYYEAEPNGCAEEVDLGVGSTPVTNTPGLLEEEELVDLWFDISPSSGPDTHVTPAGDYLVVSGDEAYRQSILRDFMSDPGEWPTNPGYGAGGRAYVKSKRTKANRDAFKARLIARAMSDPRTESVGDIRIENFADGGVKFAVPLFRKHRIKRNQPILITFDSREQ